MKELKTLGVVIPEDREKNIIEWHQKRTQHQKLAKERSEVPVQIQVDSDFHFAFIAGYTSAGFAYGITHEEYANEEPENRD